MYYLAPTAIFSPICLLEPYRSLNISAASVSLLSSLMLMLVVVLLLSIYAVQLIVSLFTCLLYPLHIIQTLSNTAHMLTTIGVLL